MTGGLDLYFSIHKGRRGKAADHWIVVCRGVRESNITDFDGDGLAVYPTSHPAVRQYVARRAELRWPRSSDEVKVVVALQRAHVKAVDNWIPFDRYLQINTPWNGTALLPLRPRLLAPRLRGGAGGSRRTSAIHSPRPPYVEIHATASSSPRHNVYRGEHPHSEVI